jgi:ABC-type polysaccharide/polyol phosphate transport system ATPase subunit
MQTVIKVENLSKRFRIGKLRQDEGTLRDLVGNLIKSPFRNRTELDEAENLWALRDINFEVKQGETFGIIGGNGAGKSTLLKILSRIIKPTSGRAALHGRVGSLLEIGTGFHPDLTGRENIFLNGAVLGMRRREVEKKFDEIVAFSDLEQFLDTPVKFYSSGMYARLAFAVAAHLEPEILIIDEVLAVGDAAFQAKCLGKMGKVAAGGRTVLFVSHDPTAVLKLCKSGLYLEKGKIKAYGDMRQVMAKYQATYEPQVAAFADAGVSRNPADIQEGEGRFTEWNTVNSTSVIPHDVYTQETVTFEFVFVLKRPTSNVSFRFVIRDINGTTLLSGTNVAEISRGTHRIQWSCDLPLKADTYKISAEAYSLTDEIVLDSWECEPQLTVLSERTPLPGEIQGLINVPTSFNVVHE